MGQNRPLRTLIQARYSMATVATRMPTVPSICQVMGVPNTPSVCTIQLPPSRVIRLKPFTLA